MSAGAEIASVWAMSHFKRKRLITTGYHLPYNPDHKKWGRDLRKNMTKPERKLWKGFLQKLDMTVLRQKPIDNFIVDFYIAKAKLVIEVDGAQHYTKSGKAYDAQRTAIFEGYGLTVLRFTNDQVMSRFDWVCRQVVQRLNPPWPPFNKGGTSEARGD